MDEEHIITGEETPMEEYEAIVPDDMTDGGEVFHGESWSDGEEESTPPVADAPAEVVPEGEGEAKAERDFAGEALSLLRAYPQLRGQRLPEEVLAACARGTHLLAAYRAYEARESRKALARVREENRVLRQNAEASRRAPVWGIGGGANEGPGDPFLDGFEMEE